MTHVGMSVIGAIRNSLLYSFREMCVSMGHGGMIEKVAT